MVSELLSVGLDANVSLEDLDRKEDIPQQHGTQNLMTLCFRMCLFVEYLLTRMLPSPGQILSLRTQQTLITKLKLLFCFTFYHFLFSVQQVVTVLVAQQWYISRLCWNKNNLAYVLYSELQEIAFTSERYNHGFLISSSSSSSSGPYHKGMLRPKSCNLCHLV